jgi:hypothetical protein
MVPILSDLAASIRRDQLSLTDILRRQHAYHEQRRWSVADVIIPGVAFTPSARDRAFLWHAARAELTTQPAGIRLAVIGVRLANELSRSNPLGAKVLHAAAAWSARYWLEEEAHHEVAFHTLLAMAGPELPVHDEVAAHRGEFPEDNFARMCVLQACVEIEAVVSYGHIAQAAHDPLVQQVFLKVMRDEAQHRQYFISFAKALVDSGAFPVKDILSMAFAWIRPDAGETLGSDRKRQSHREGFINWWDHVVQDVDDPLVLWDDVQLKQELHEKKCRSLLTAVRHMTGLTVSTVDQLRRAYLASLRTPNVPHINEMLASPDRGCRTRVKVTP